MDSGKKINTMIVVYVLKLGFKAHYINVGAQKLDNSTLETFSMVLINFQIKDKLKRARFFQETFLLANIRAEVVLSMLFLIFNNINIKFSEKKLS